MKRSTVCSDLSLPPTPSPSPKRVKPSIPSSVCEFAPPLRLTAENLATISLCSSLRDSKRSIEKWRDVVDSSELMTTPPKSPSVTSERTRRATKQAQRQHPYRSQNSTKKASSEYRSVVLFGAQIFVDCIFTHPSDVEKQLLNIFDVPTLSDIGKAVKQIDRSNPSDESTSERISQLNRWAKNYLASSQELASLHVGEGQWKMTLFKDVMAPLKEIWPDILNESASEKPWIPTLRPTRPSFEDVVAISGEPVIHSPDAITPDFTQSISEASGAPILSPPSTSVPTDYTTDNSDMISRPKPDVTLGLAIKNFSTPHRWILQDLQNRGLVLSDPHQSRINLHFPFFLVEAKGLSAGSNMHGAQNQAAGDVSCALAIFDTMKSTVQCHAQSLPRVDEPTETDETTTKEASSVDRQIAFSLTTEGPIHELWVHFKMDAEFHMTHLRTWRTTQEAEATAFVHTLHDVFRWGATTFRAQLTRDLDIIQRGMQAETMARSG